MTVPSFGGNYSEDSGGLIRVSRWFPLSTRGAQDCHWIATTEMEPADQEENSIHNGPDHQQAIARSSTPIHSIA